MLCVMPKWPVRENAAPSRIPLFSLPSMLTVTSTRSAQPYLSLSPSKRQKIPSPQKPLQKGFFTPAKTEPFERLKSLQHQSNTAASVYDIDVQQSTLPTDHLHHPLPDASETDISADETQELNTSKVCPDVPVEPLSLSPCSGAPAKLVQTSDETPPVTVVLPVTDMYPRKIVMP